MPLPDPVIVVPGITAGTLHDHYVMPPDDLWTVIGHKFERLALHPDNLRFEASGPAVVRPGQLFEIAYNELISELRHNLSPNADQPVPVYPFSFDWRQPLERVETELGAFIEDVIARTSVTRHYAIDGYAARRKVNLVGHSMGGLVIAGYVASAAAAGRVNKVATLGTPYRGSLEAIIKITTGTSNLGATPPNSREREASRLTPALYYLLPDLMDGITIDPALPQTLYDPACWQPSIVQSIAEYIRRHGINSVDINGQATRLFTKLLNDARSHRQRLNTLDLARIGLSASDWLCVVGVNSTTRVRLQVIRQPDGSADFRFHDADRGNGWEDNNPALREFTGDGTVPFSGAVPPFLRPENLVCVTTDDFGYWEVEDKVTASVAGFHGIMSNMDMLHRLIVRHFTGAPDTHENTWGRAAPGVANWVPPLPLTQKP